MGEDVGRVGGSAPRAQQLGGLQRHGTNYYRRAVAIRYFRVPTVHGEENWCYKPEELLHHRRLVQCLSMVIGAGLGGRWMTMDTGRLHFFWVKLVVERALEACPRWCSAKPEADAAAASACRACCGVTTGT